MAEKKYDVIIVGGGPAGFTTALSARNTYPDKTIALIRKEPIALIPCGIPYVVHTLDTVEDDILPDAPLKNNKIDIIIDEVEDKDGKEIILKSGDKLEYDKLVLALGSVPFMPLIKGNDKEGVFLVKKDIEYLKRLKDAIKNATHVLIIGGGFIGVELADEILKAGKKVTIIEKLPHLLSLSMDEEFGEIVEEEIKKMGAVVKTNTIVTEITGNGKVEGVVLENGEKIECDLVIISAGYRPNISIAQKFGVNVRERFGIIIDEYMRTSEKDIFAVGDCTAKRNCFTGEYSKIMLASTAMAQGRLAGSNLFEIKVVKTFPGILGTFSTKIGNVAVGVTGLTEKDAKGMGIDYVIGTTETVDRHPGKLPGASKIKMKLLFARYSHVLLGAQIAGGNSIGEIINMLSVIIQNRMTDMEIDTLQIGTHPLLTSSPIAYPVINATVSAILKWYQKKDT